MSLKTQRLLGSQDDYRQNHSNYPTFSSEEQYEIECRCSQLLNKKTPLLRIEHIDYLFRSLELLPQSYTSLDSSRPWLLYWILHSLAILNQKLSNTQINQCLNLLKICQNSSGGFGGHPLHHSHLAPTYAAVNSLAILAQLLENLEILNLIDRKKMYEFLFKMKQPNGSFSVTEDGECDTRAIYTALCVATLLNILDGKLKMNTIEFLVNCQTYEGGFGGEPLNEAHGGYAFCAIAALVLLDGVHLINFEKFVKWTVHRQMVFEGGFQGRTHKLVDGCYSFWVGGIFPIIDLILENELNLEPQKRNKSTEVKSKSVSLFDSLKLQNYILNCCQQNSGGLKDKPGKYADLYHSCYCLSGLAVCRNEQTKILTLKKSSPTDNEIQSESTVDIKIEEITSDNESNDQNAKSDDQLVEESLSILFTEIHPIYNISMEQFEAISSYFEKKPPPE